MMTVDVTDSDVRIRRAFDAAFLRMCAAKNPETAEDELSNLLCQIYRLRELVRKRKFGGNNERFNDALCDTLEGSTARATLWARTFDTHDAVVVGKMGDISTDYYTEMYGTLVLRPLTDLPEQSSKYGQHDDYATYLAGRAVLETARLAFDKLAAMA
jgi:hypothetical protein